MASIWHPRSKPYDGPVCIIGAGVLGRRLAIMWASRGGTVHIVDTMPEVREDALKYFNETEKPCQPGCQPGELKAFDNIPEAIQGAWLVIESIPERLPLKIDVWEQLDKLANPDAILATNSSSYRSSEMAEKVKGRHRMLNVHAFMPPQQ